MITKVIKNLDYKTRHKILQGSIIPRPIAWITTLNDNNSINLAPFSYFNMMSSTIISVSIQRKDNKQKDTARNILRTKEAVIHIPDMSLIEAMDFSAKPLEVNESEIDLIGLETIKSELVDVAGLKDAKIRLEATLDAHIPLRNFDDDNEIEADLFLLRVVAVHLDETIFDQEKEYILHENLKPLARLAGTNYATIKTLTHFKRQFI